MEAFVDYVLSLNNPMLLIVFLNMVGFLIKKSPINDTFIPLILVILGAIIYPLLVDKTIPLVKAIMFGALFGGTSIGVNQLYRQAGNLFNENKNVITPDSSLKPPGTGV